MSNADEMPGPSRNVTTTDNGNQKKNVKRTMQLIYQSDDSMSSLDSPLSVEGENPSFQGDNEYPLDLVGIIRKTSSMNVMSQSTVGDGTSKGKGKKTKPIVDDNVMESQEITSTNQTIAEDPQPSTSGYTQTSTSQEEVASAAPHQDVYSDPQPSTSSYDANAPKDMLHRKRVNLYAPDVGPQLYYARGNLVTRPIITKNLPLVFQYLPVHGKPGPNTTLQEFYRNKAREYVGCGLTEQEFKDLENYCCSDLLKTGRELKMQTNVPVMGILNSNILHNHFSKPDLPGDEPNLVVLKKNKLRLEKDIKGLFNKKLKYRGVRVLSFAQEEPSTGEEEPSPEQSKEPDVELEPGTDILYKVRIYRPYSYSMAKDRLTRSRHSVFSCDVLLPGRHRLTALRDRFVCHNDFDMRVDVSAHPELLPTAKAKEVFPSGFLFINNVFYVDTREGCIDYSAPIREWARKRKLGDFPRKDMCAVRLQDLVLKLGYPDVYVHQGNCEHVFLFSEVRLLNVNDPLVLSKYPCMTSIAQNQTVYCTTCAEFSAKWIVVGSDRVPFDPGFFCDKCFKQYMYKDGQKIGEFKAYRYRGNALNLLKP